jgi:NTE family protein
LVCGTSIGSINGALICSGWDADKMEELWTSLDNKKIFSVSLARRIKYRMKKWLGRHPNWPAFIDSEPLRETLSEAVDVQRIRQNQPRLVVAATNFRRAIIEYFTGEDLSIEHILASCSIPVVFPWCEIEGELYWDGGILSNTPVFPAIEAGAREILVVMLSPIGGQLTETPKTTVEGISRMFDMMTLASSQSLNQSLAYHLGRDLRSHTNTLSQQILLDLGDIRVGVVAPKVDPSITTVMGLDPEHVKVRIAAGYNDAREQLNNFLGRREICNF